MPTPRDLSAILSHITAERAKALMVALSRVPSPLTELMEAEPQLRAFIDAAVEPRLRAMGIIDIVHDRMGNLAEVSMAFNPSGHVCGVAMETESALGTAHIALGNSIAYGGTVDAIAHLDCVMKNATLELDGRPVMVAGVLV